MKVALKVAVGWVAIWGIGYIAGSFTAASFDLSGWTYESRSLIAMFASLFCGLLVPMLMANEESSRGLR